MKDLNLSSDFSLFSWDENDETKTSYETLTSKGLTSNFFYSTWMLILNTLKSLQEEMNLSWSDTYGSGEATDATSPYSFKASMFNAVILNLSKDINSVFPWEVDKSFEGFLGRKYVIGCNDDLNTQGDFVYASYFLEIVSRLNTFINICKNLASFSSFSLNLINYSLSKNDLTNILSTTLNSNLVLLVSHYSQISTSLPLILNIDLLNKDVNSSIITLKDSTDTLKVCTINKTMFNVSITLDDLYSNLVSYLSIIAKITPNLKVTNKKKIFEIDEVVEEIFNVCLVISNVLNLVINTLNVSSTNTILGLSSPYSIILSFTNYSLFDTNLVALVGYALNASYIFYSESSLTLTKHKLNTFNVTSSEILKNKEATLEISLYNFFNSIISSSISSNAIFSALNTESSFFVCGTLNFNIKELNLVILEISKLITKTYNSLVFDVNLTYDVAVTMNHKIKYVYGITSSLSEGIAIILGSIINSRLSITSEMISLVMTYTEAFISSSVTTYSKINRYKNTNSSYMNLDLLASISSILTSVKYDYYLVAFEELKGLESFSLSIIDKITLNISSSFYSLFSLVLSLKEASQTFNVDTNILDDSSYAKLLLILDRKFKASDSIMFNVSAEISFDSSSWLNPVKDDEVLYLYQIYNASQEDDILYIDKEGE